ncbi:transglycosylase SLT domain-containing protein [Amycolatopsis anabasis]|uniref:transglycosylase SLT domain-containing protein n=1 Tax=Amycolatopsis anabasis TaxID=1840409 RepID=UPI00131D419E|nr:transglycosylase SLT domain-containing protein [Amycolatopsis anabasis]
MSKLSAEEIAQHAYRAGFRGQGLTTAVAVALAESGGNTRAHNGTPPDNSYGLWQINMLGSMGPERRRQYHLSSNNELFNAADNARVAYQISGHGKNWGPWSTYTNGAYRKHLSQATKAAHAVTARHGKGGGGGGQPKGGAHHPKGGGGAPHGGGRAKPPAKGSGGGFAVDTDALTAYTKQARRIGDELAAVGNRNLRAVHGIAADSFGKVGKETGFAKALGDFSTSLQRQVKGVGTNADRLGDQAAKAAKVFRDQEDDIARGIGKIF